MSGRGGGGGGRPQVDKAADFANYFCTYAYLYHQKDMLSDRVRMNAYRDAVMKNKAHFKDKVVLDVGTGSGILAIWAAQAGARMVYAVEATDMANHAKTLAQANGVGERVRVFQESVEDVVLPEKVDVIISEWMGYFLVRESMLDSVLVARDRWLKPGGSLFPSHARMWIAPVHSSLWEGRMGDYRGSMADWHSFVRSTRDDYGVNMAVLDPTYETEQRKYFLQTGCWESLYPSQVLGRPVMIREIDCGTTTIADVEEVKAHFTTHTFTSDKPVNAFAGWFDVLFKGSAAEPTAHEVQLTTAPSVDEGTHWGQQVFLLPSPLPVAEGDVLSGAISIRRSARNHRLMDVDLHYSCQHTNGVTTPDTKATLFIE